MNEQRFGVSDMLWKRLEPHLPGKVSDAGATAKDFWKLSSGGYAQGRRGATCRLPLVTGTASSGDFADGPGPEFSRAFSRL